MTPLLPWRPAILSPTWSFLFMATKTLTVLFTPGASSSPLARRATRSALTLLMTSICEIGPLEDEPHLVADLLVLQLEPLEHAGVIRPIFSMVSLPPSLTRTLPCESETSSRTVRPESSDSIFSFASVRMMRISSSAFFVEAADLFVEDLLGPHVLLLLFVLAREDLHVDDDALDAGGHLSEASRTSPAFSPKMARRSFSSGVSCVSPFGVTLPTRMSPGSTFAPMRTMPDSSRSRSACSETFGMSFVISSAPSFVVARLDLELLDVDGGVVVLLDHLLGDQDRVLEVVAAPRHERDQDVAAEGELALRRATGRPRGPGPGRRGLLGDDGLLVDAGVLVRAAELEKR